ncbi:ABC transporter permease [Bailinhaonella thermotolerans]|uniref:Transport permease protein n=1 Tax=Bailinhaonella thermotolerans TaxID=1070861 RepID=A0A3A4BDS8_9ACTN|nr:ABC transporter permease [Bailinhaonella thermotolerans]RJL32460.1 ABC transporter permease [Bailinhaonella thermotolerans]
MFIRDSAAVFHHAVRATFRTKAGVLIGAVQPLLYLALLGPLLARAVPGGGGWEVVVPGILLQLVLMSAGLAGFGVVFDRQTGVLERLRVTPASRAALLTGRVLRDALVLVAQSALILALGFALGLRAPVAGVLAGLAFVLVPALGLAALSYAVALRLPPEVFPPVMTTAIVPLMLLSGVFLPMSMAPGWLDAVSRAMPLRYVVDAMRDLFAGHYATGSVGIGLAVSVVFLAVALAAGTRAFQRESA